MHTLRRLHRLRNQVECELYLPWLNLQTDASPGDLHCI